MKFSSIYEDLILEERPLSNEKLDMVVDALPEIIFTELSNNPRSVFNLPQISYFKERAKEMYGQDYDVTDPDILLLIINDHLESFLNKGMNAVQQTRFIKQLKSGYPRIAEKIDALIKKPSKWVEGGRGRPPKKKEEKGFEFPLEYQGRRLVPIGSRPINQIQQPPSYDFNPEEYEDEPFQKNDEVSSEPKRRGRPKLYDDSMSAMKRWKIKKEGPEAIDALQKKHDAIQTDVDKQLERMKKIMQDIETRKKYFGLE